MKKVFIFSLLLLSGIAATAHASSVDDLLQRADDERAAFDYRDAINDYEQALMMDPLNFNALCNISYLYQKTGWLKPDALRKQYFSHAMDYARKAYSLNPNSYLANMVMAGSIARMAEFDPPKERVQAAWDIKKYADAALSINPNGPDVWYLIGWWNFEMAQATWLERTLASAFFGGLPGGGSYDTGIQCLEKANLLKPNDIIYLYDLSTFYEKVNNNAKAATLCREALGCRPQAPDEKVYYDKCKELLARLT